MYTIFRNLSVNALTAPADIDRRIGAVAAKTAGLPPDALRSWRILAKSVDSRRGAPPRVYTLLAEVEGTSAAARKLEPVPPEMLAQFEAPRLELPETTLLHPLVVGTGPAGIFAALALAMAGTRPIVLDRGPEVEPRFAAVQHFLETRELEESANLLIGELYRNGHRKIAYYAAHHDAGTPFQHYSGVLRQQGFDEEIARLGLPAPEGDGDAIKQPAAFLRHHVVHNGVTAVICYDHERVLRLMHAAVELKLRIPEDFSLICYDDAPELELLTPSVTGCFFDSCRIGSTAARLLVERMENDSAPGSRVVKIPGKLMLRQSVAALEKDILH